MIISASRRTDIPAFYGDWFMNRVFEGFVKTKNPFNPEQIREISLKKEDVDCFVFWTKDPAPMLPGLKVLDEAGYQYYFQFTLTPYGKELEHNLRPKSEIIKTFKALSGNIGSERVAWRYDPIILNGGWSAKAHAQAFEELCVRLAGYTRRVIISFVDMYKKVKTDKIREISPAEMNELASLFSGIASEHGLKIFSCCEAADFSEYGIQKSSCIDKTLIEQLLGRPVEAKPDRNQRTGCGCCQSVDIGAYNTCRNGCVYCYANHSPESTRKRIQRHNPLSEFLID